MVGIAVIDTEGDTRAGDDISERFGIGYSSHQVDIIDVVGSIGLHHPKHELFYDLSPQRIPDNIYKPVREYL